MECNSCIDRFTKEDQTIPNDQGSREHWLLLFIPLNFGRWIIECLSEFSHSQYSWTASYPLDRLHIYIGYKKNIYIYIYYIYVFFWNIMFDKNTNQPRSTLSWLELFDIPNHDVCCFMLFQATFRLWYWKTSWKTHGKTAILPVLALLDFNRVFWIQ